MEILEGTPACHNSPQRLERVSLWHFVGETGMTFFSKIGKKRNLDLLSGTAKDGMCGHWRLPERD